MMPMRLLVYRLGSLGDTILALPCFHLIRAAFPEARITVLTNAPVSGKAAALESILGTTGLIDEVIPYPLGLRDPGQVRALRSRLRAGKFDQVISLTAARGLASSLRDQLFFRLCGIRRITGIPWRRRDLICGLQPDGVLYESEARRLLRRISELGEIDLAERRWLDLRLTPPERSEAGHLLAEAHFTGRFIAASIGTKSPLNDWGQNNWARLLTELSRRHPELGLALLGSADEEEPSATLLKKWSGPRINLCGKTSPRLSAALLERATLFLGHDSGPMHLAAAAGVRCVAIFSARCPPGQWFPIGLGHIPLYPCSFWNPKRTADLTYQQQALASIGVDVVLAAIEQTLAAT